MKMFWFLHFKTHIVVGFRGIEFLISLFLLNCSVPKFKTWIAFSKINALKLSRITYLPLYSILLYAKSCKSTSWIDYWLLINMSPPLENRPSLNEFKVCDCKLCWKTLAENKHLFQNIIKNHEINFLVINFLFLNDVNLY